MVKEVKQKLIRGFGVLMPISAIPSPYGIGTFGDECYQFIDFLERSGSRYWQVLPMGPTSYGDSPYQSFSAFAGNPYFIDLDVLIKEGLLKYKEVEKYRWQISDEDIDYERLFKQRFSVLKLAFTRSKFRNEESYHKFCEDQNYWLEDYCFYMALKTYFDHKEWLLWKDDIRNRNAEAISKYKELLSEDIEFWKFCQFKFKQQWEAIKNYANRKGIQIIGDIPLYVALDSADVWVHGELFELDERKHPIRVAGVPPDAFSEWGQRWGNPLYLWDKMKEQDYKWWRERMKMSSSLYDIIRIDHFIGIVNYFAIPSKCPTAKEGKWEIGPGKDLTDVIKDSIGNAKIIAEDLGIITPQVRELIEEIGYPGMKVLMFGFEGPPDNAYMPHNFTTANTVAYIGTHDNDTLIGYLKSKSKKEIEMIEKYYNVKNLEELIDTIVRTLYASVADVAIIQMQDILKLDNKARINLPSTIGGNWKWRLKKQQYKKIDEKYFYELAVLYGRR